MIYKSALLPLVAVSCLALQIDAFSQQFRSARRVIASPSPATKIFADIQGVGDFNGDGRPDFLAKTFNYTENGGTAVIAVMLQNADGTFKEKDDPTLPIAGSGGNFGAAVAVADVNGDGKADVISVVPGPEDNSGNALGPATLVIAYGNGDGTFRVQSPINLASDRLTGVMVQDLNHDGRPDIISVSADFIGNAVLQTFQNNGGGIFRPAATHSGFNIGQLLAGADFNGDGFPDLSIVNGPTVQILLGKGDGGFSQGAAYDIRFIQQGAAADLNGDHRMDLVLVTSGGTRILIGKGDGTFTMGRTLDTTYGTAGAVVNNIVANGLYVGDVNHDGIPDVVATSGVTSGIPFGSTTGAVSVYYGKGDATFTNPKAFNFGSSEFTPFFDDFNRDGHIDVIEPKARASYVVAYGTADSGFNAPVVAQARAAGSIVTGDFNRDGIEDIAVVEEPVCGNPCTGAFVRVFLGTAKGFFAPPRNYSIPVNWGAMAAGDVNGDGRLDLVVTRNAGIINARYWPTYTTPDLTVLLGRGDGTFDAPASYTLLGKPADSTFSDSVSLVDVNHDGKLDLVGDWGVALGKGTGQFGKPVPLPTGITGIVAVAPGNFNATGTVDLAVASDSQNPVDIILHTVSAPAYVYVLSGNGDGSFRVISKHSATGVLNRLVTADLNEDGLSDILYTSSFNPGSFLALPSITLGVDLSEGHGAFSTTAYSYNAGSYLLDVTDIVTGDFNRDGKLDVAIPAVFANGADLALLFGIDGGELNKTPQYYQGSIGKAVVLNINGDDAPDIAGTSMAGVSRLLNTGRK